MERVSIPGDGEGVLVKRERLAGKERSDHRERGVEEIRAGVPWRLGLFLEEQETVEVSSCKGLQVLVPKISRGRVLVLIARSPKFDVYQPLAVAGISSEILDGT